MSARQASRVPGVAYAPPPLVAEFDLLEEIGHGASSVVYRARRRADGIEVALKVMRPSGGAEGTGAERLAHELRTTSHLSHPGIVAPLDVRSLPDGRLALVLPLVRGRTLRQVLREGGQLPAPMVERVLRDIASALAHAHAQGIAHLDVKPENIFLDGESGRALLADFGIARRVDTEAGAHDAAAGTPTYMAPEQVDGREVNGATDLYSLGLVAWEMLSGERPWMGEELDSILRKQKSEPLPPLDALRPDVPVRLHFLVERLTSKTPAGRWDDAGAFLGEWERVAPREGWRRWRLERRARGRAWSESRERLMRDVSGFAERLQRLAIQTDVPTLERLEVSEAGRGGTRRRRGVWAALIVFLAAGAGSTAAVLHERASRVPRIGASIPLRDGRGIEVPTLPAAHDSGAHHDSTAATATDSTAAAAAARIDSGMAEREASPAPERRDRAAVPDTARGEAPISSSLYDAPLAVARGSAPPPPAPARASTAPAIAPAPPTLLSAGGRHSCAVAATGMAFCWGSNDEGALGDAGSASRTRGAPVADAHHLTQVSSGTAHTCAITAEGEALCWGRNDRGQLGDRTTSSRAQPTPVANDWRYRAVHAGGAHSCAITVVGQVACWGSNDYGQVGGPLTGTITAPILVAGLSARVVALSSGRSHTCALDADGAAWCWGRNASGQLGDGSSVDRRTPVRVGASMRFVSIAAGGAHTCAVAVDGSAWCWGANAAGQLGVGGASPDGWRVPTRVDTAEPLADITAGASHSCARTRAETLLCWGQNIYGQLGDGTMLDRPRPVAVATPLRFFAVAASAVHTCAQATTGERFCWGYNVDGQVGDGTRDNRPRPTRVVLLSQ